MRWEKRVWLGGRRLLIATVTLVATLGCNGDGATTTSRTTPADLKAFIDAYCGMARNCCQSAGFPAEPLVDCESELVRQTDFTPLLERGTVLVNEAELSACVGAIRQAQTTCVAPDLERACQEVFRGTRDLGGPCADVFECRSQSEPTVCFHLRPPDGGDALGICRAVPRGAAGDPCFASCRPGESCRSDHITPLEDTVITLCHEADGLYCGQVCERLLNAGDACDSSSACGSSAFCDTTCKPRGNSGASCTASDGCARGLYCLENRCQQRPVATDKLCSGDYD